MVLFTFGLWLQARRHTEPEALDRVDLGGIRPRDVARVWPWVGLALVAMLVNPVGIHALTSPLGLGTGGIVTPSDRLSTLSTLDTAGFNRLVALALVVMVMWATVLGRMHRGALTVMVFATAFALLRLHAVGDFGLLAVALIGPPFGEAFGSAVRRHGPSMGKTAIVGEQRLSRWITGAVLIAMLGITLVCLPRGAHWRLGFGVNESRHPAEALEFLARHAPDEGEGFHPIEWGGMVLWDLNERRRVYIDHRLDLYGEDFIQTDYMRVAQAFEQSPSWSTILDDRNVSWVLLDRRDLNTGSLAQALYRRQEAQPPDQRSWGLVHFDDLALLFFRRASFDEETWADLAIDFRADNDWMREVSPALLQIHPEWRERLVRMVQTGQGGRIAAWLLLTVEEKLGNLEHRRLALERLRQGELGPNEQARIEHALGLLLMQEGEHEMALAHLRAAQDLDPRSAEIAVALAGALWNLRLEPEAVAAYEAVLDLDPQHPEAREALIAHQEGRLWAEHPDGAPE
jgi:tetratricopeptide (TPR) repeat protein